MGFKEARVLQTPDWLGGPQGYGYQRALGESIDDEVALTKGALRVRYPHPIGPIDALGPQGQDRRILRIESPLALFGVGNVKYAARLTNAHELWYWAGTKSGMAAIFDPFAPTDTRAPPAVNDYRYDRATEADVIAVRSDRGDVQPEVFHGHTAGVSTFAAFYSAWEWGGFWFGETDWYSTFYGLIDSTAGVWTVDGLWDDPGDWDDGKLWEITMTDEQAKYIRLSMRRMKPVDSYPVTIAIDLDLTDGFWGSPGLWDDGGDWTDDVDGSFYLTIGNVWGQEEWLQPGTVDLWDGEGLWEAFVNPLAT
jgi:hypothetical protein